jgi:hypothetical protein
LSTKAFFTGQIGKDKKSTTDNSNKRWRKRYSYPVGGSINWYGLSNAYFGKICQNIDCILQR